MGYILGLGKSKPVESRPCLHFAHKIKNLCFSAEIVAHNYDVHFILLLVICCDTVSIIGQGHNSDGYGCIPYHPQN
jgi:hypothetical protein